MSVSGKVPAVEMGSRVNPLDRPAPSRAYGRDEEIADLCVHVAGILAGLYGAATLLVAAGTLGSTRLLVGLLLYVAGLLSMLIASALYNLTPPSPLKALL